MAQCEANAAILMPAQDTRGESKPRRRKKLGQLPFERIRNFDDVEQGHVALATLYLPHVRAIDAGGVCQCLLRYSASLATLPDGSAQLRQAPFAILLT